jgi:hypothetical protein
LGRGVEKKKLRLVPYNHPLEQDHDEQAEADQEKEGPGECKIGIGKMEFQERLFFH